MATWLTFGARQAWRHFCTVRYLILVALLLASGQRVMAQEGFEEVQAYLDKTVEEGVWAGGVLLVLHKGEIVFETGFGYADIAARKPMRADMTFRIASISKPMLGTAAFRLVDAGVLDPTVPITKYLPEFADARLESGERLTRAPNLIELLSHTSGIQGDDDGPKPWHAKWARGKSLAYAVGKFPEKYLFKAQPGTRFRYSGTGTDVAARVMEVAAGELRNELLVETLCKPLGMEHTFYRDSQRMKGVSVPNRYKHNKSGKLFSRGKGKHPAPNVYGPSGGSIASTARDMAIWLEMIRNRGMHNGKRFMSAETINEMLRRGGGNRTKCGFAIRKKGKGKDSQPIVIGHTGSSGVSCFLDFKQKTVAITLTQTPNIKTHRRKFEKMVTNCVAKNY